MQVLNLRESGLAMLLRLKAYSGLLLTALLLCAACAPLPTPAPLVPTATVPAPTRMPSVATPVLLPTPEPSTPTPIASPTPTSKTQHPKSQIIDALERLGATPCPASAFTCVTLNMPLDHDAPVAEDSATIPVVFGVLPASGLRKGMLVVAVGGPGSSGLALADAYVDAYDPRLRERFDIVFFDQRGTGLSRGIQCPEAAADYYAADTAFYGRRAVLLEAARVFAGACVTETGAADVLPFLSTRQAVADLERFRQIVGADRLWLYGESYGTQFVQTYATRYPAQVAGLVLDGAVDLTLSAVDYAAESALAFEDTLAQTLAACAGDVLCADDMAGDPNAAYDRLLAALARGPVVFQFPLSTGDMAERTLSHLDINTAVASYLSAPDARLLALRAIAAGAQGDFVPLARLLYSALGLHPDTLAPVPNPDYSDAAYYAVTCLDYADAEADSHSPAARAAAWLTAGQDVIARAPRLGAMFYGDLPCAFWPAVGRRDPRPAPFIAPGIPTLVLAATADPLTPFANGERVFRRLEDGYFVATRGGAHVMFGRGNRCVDNAVARFLVEGIPPAQRETICADAWLDNYVPIAPADVTGFSDLLEAIRSLNNEIEHLPDYFYWDGAGKVVVGCARGGWVSFEMRGEQVVFALEACSFSRGLAFTGAGEYDLNADQFSLEGRVDGAAAGALAYVRSGDGRARVTGTYAGRAVDVAR